MYNGKKSVCIHKKACIDVYVYDYKQEDDIACAKAAVLWYCSKHTHLFSVIGHDDRKDYDNTKVGLDEIAIRNIQVPQL